jgi:hypothetical protein
MMAMLLCVAEFPLGNKVEAIIVTPGMAANRRSIKFPRRTPMIDVIPGSGHRLQLTSVHTCILDICALCSIIRTSVQQN